MKEADFLNVLGSFVGVRENPPGSNLTPIGAEFGYNGVAWCAETVSVACRRLGFPLHEAAVVRIEDHARAGDWGMGWTRTPIRGAAVCFDWSGRDIWADMHVGVVTDVLDGGRFRTIEGNYRDSCARVLRDMTYVRGFATFPFEDASTPTPQPSPAPPQPQSQEDSDLVANLPTLQRGSNGQQVKNLQGLLRAANQTVDIDGDFASQTEGALKAWQQAANVPGGPDGICGTNSWRWLLGLH